MTTTIAGIVGSLRRGSSNRMLLEAAGQALPPDAELAVFELLDQVPPFSEDSEAGPGPARQASRRDQRQPGRPWCGGGGGGPAQGADYQRSQRRRCHARRSPRLR
jgi:hypothetical protein